MDSLVSRELESEMPFSTPIILIDLYIKKVNMPECPEYAYLGLGVVDQVKRKVTDLEPLEPFLYTTINTIRDWVNDEPVDVSAPVVALIQELTGCGYTDFDIIMGTLPQSTILDTLFETERSTDER